MSPRRKTMTVALGLTGFAVLLGGCNPATGNVATGADKSASASNLSAASANASTPSDASAHVPGVPANALEGDVLVPEGFNASATVSCVTRAGRAPRDCSAGVVRNRDGSAIVTIFWPEGRSRAIFFDASHRAYGADTSEADGTAEQPFRATRQGDNNVVTIGPERYVIPGDLVVGG